MSNQSIHTYDDNSLNPKDTLLNAYVTCIDAQLDVSTASEVTTLKCSGDWDFAGIQSVDQSMRDIELKSIKSLTINTTYIRHFDTAGAWLVERLRQACVANDVSFNHHDTDARRIRLVEVIKPDEVSAIKQKYMPKSAIVGLLEHTGRFVADLGQDFLQICNMIGATIRGPQMKAGRKGGIRLTSIISQIDHMGLRAIPVIAVMSFLIGAIIAQQGAFQLRAFGEELLTVNLLSILLLREIGVLLTAIMVAGRTGSAIAAELGSMKMREEIDALRVIGLNPTAVLVFPRMVALIIALPILTLLADFCGLAGGMMVTWLYIDIQPQQFITALHPAIDLTTLFSGLIKAPFMAAAIALISAVEGMKVGGSAESLGQHTTNAVVRSIFVVILLDGLFAIFYAAIDY